MKKLCFPLLGLMVWMSACNMEPHSYKNEIATMEDTLFKAFPTVNRVSVEVATDFTPEINITLGDKQLYNASETDRKQVAVKATTIVKYVFKKNLPEKGKVIFVAEENTLNNEEASKKIYPLDLNAEK